MADPDTGAGSAESAKTRYRRILLKLSGEALMGPAPYGIHVGTLELIANEIREIHDMGVELAVVIGGGNIFRGVAGSASGMDRSSADHMGMLATVINGLALQDALEKMDVHTRVQTAFDIQALAETYIRRRAIRHLEKGRVVILTAGTGNPYFTTDTAAGLRALEIHAEIIFKATKVDGIYDADPVEHPDAKLLRKVSFLEVLNMGLRVMDSTAISLCMDNDLPIRVFNLKVAGNIKKAVQGEAVGTLVSAEGHGD